MVEQHLLVDRGRFRFIGLPLKIRGGTNSPVRAAAVFERAKHPTREQPANSKNWGDMRRKNARAYV
jgi:hypothetical protein